MSMSVYARQQLVDFQDVGYGSAAATMLFLIIAADHRGLPDRRPRRPGGLSMAAASPAPPRCRHAAGQAIARLDRLLRPAGDHRPLHGVPVLLGDRLLAAAPAPSCSTTDLIPPHPAWAQLRRGVPRAAVRPQHPELAVRRDLDRGRCRWARGAGRLRARAGSGSAAGCCCCSPSSASRCSRRSPCCRACSSWSAGSASTTTCWR